MSISEEPFELSFAIGKAIQRGLEHLYTSVKLELPDLPEAEFSLRVPSGAERQSLDLATLLAEGLAIQMG